jgi:hypothetical protein
MSSSSPAVLRVRLESALLDWQGTGSGGVQRKPILGAAELPELALVVDLYRLESGHALPSCSAAREVVVVSGSWSLAGVELGPLGYARGHFDEDAAGPAGCELLVRTPARSTREPLVLLPYAPAGRLAGHGNLLVWPLPPTPDSNGTDSSALVFWPAGERFVPHRHFGGEEIFVLAGVFEDEHGRHPAGTWLLGGHLSAHHPFVREETVIFVKTGHLGVGPGVDPR